MNLSCIILTISDRSSKGEREDASGPALTEVIQKQGWAVQGAEIIPDVKDIIALLGRKRDSIKKHHH